MLAHGRRGIIILCAFVNLRCPWWTHRWWLITLNSFFQINRFVLVFIIQLCTCSTSVIVLFHQFLRLFLWFLWQWAQVWAEYWHLLFHWLALMLCSDTVVGGNSCAICRISCDLADVATQGAHTLAIATIHQQDLSLFVLRQVFGVLRINLQFSACWKCLLECPLRHGRMDICGQNGQIWRVEDLTRVLGLGLGQLVLILLGAFLIELIMNIPQLFMIHIINVLKELFYLEIMRTTLSDLSTIAFISGLFAGQFYSQKLAWKIFWIWYIPEVFIFKRHWLILNKVIDIAILDFQWSIQLDKLTAFSTPKLLLVHLSNSSTDMRYVLGKLICRDFQIWKVKFIVFSSLFCNVLSLLKTWINDFYRIVESQRLDWWIFDHLHLFFIFSISLLIFFQFIVLVSTSRIIWNFVNVVAEILKDILLCHDLIICRISQLGHCHVIWGLVHLAKRLRILMRAASSANAKAFRFLGHTLMALSNWSWACDGNCSTSWSRSKMLRVKCTRMVELRVLILIIDFAINNCLLNGC